MNEYGKQVKKQMDTYIDNPDSIDKEISDIQNATHGVEVRGALAAGVKKSFDKSVEARDITENLLDGSYDQGLLNTEIENRMDNLYNTKGQAMDELHDAKETELDNLKQEYADKATTLETTYAPRLTSIETEIEDARGGETNLGDRLNDFSSQLAQTTNEIENVKTVKMDKDTNDISVSQINKNKGKFDQTYVTDEFLQQMAGNTPINTVPANKSITRNKIIREAIGSNEVDFIEKSSNLFDKNDVVEGYAIDLYGKLTENKNYVVSNYVEVLPSTPYQLSKIIHVSFFDENFNFLSRIEATDIDLLSVNTTDNTYYVRLNVQKVYIKTAQLNQGSELLPYEEYYLKLGNKGNLRDDVAFNLERDIPQKTLTADLLDFTEFSSNLINMSEFEDRVVINSDGSEGSSASWTTSHFFKVTPKSDYVTNSIRYYSGRWVFYNNKKEFISVKEAPSTKDYFHKITTPTNAYYAKVSFNKNVMHEKPQVNKGAELLPYEPYYIKLVGVNLEKEDVRTTNRYVERLKPDEVYTAPTQDDVSTTSPNNLKALSHTEIYALYDELVDNYPDYASKQLLGTESTERELYRYDFKPPRTEQSGVKIPKVFITAGTHGSEKTGVWCCLQAMKQLCEEWENSTSLEYLRWGVHFIVIPILNPSGWDHIDQYGLPNGRRKNGNDVDLARNFPTGWFESEITSPTYGGSEPLSELETQYANEILEAEKENLVYVCDFHNFFTTDGFIWNASATNFQVNLGEHLVSKMSRKWKKEHPTMIPQDETTLVGYADLSAPNGSIGLHATSFDVHGGTFEVSELFAWEAGGVKNSPNVIKFGLEAFVNWLMLVIKNNIKI